MAKKTQTQTRCSFPQKEIDSRREETELEKGEWKKVCYDGDKSNSVSRGLKQIDWFSLCRLVTHMLLSSHTWRQSVRTCCMLSRCSPMAWMTVAAGVRFTCCKKNTKEEVEYLKTPHGFNNKNGWWTAAVSLHKEWHSEEEKELFPCLRLQWI